MEEDSNWKGNKRKACLHERILWHCTQKNFLAWDFISRFIWCYYLQFYSSNICSFFFFFLLKRGKMWGPISCGVLIIRPVDPHATSFAGLHPIIALMSLLSAFAISALGWALSHTLFWHYPFDLWNILTLYDYLTKRGSVFEYLFKLRYKIIY